MKSSRPILTFDVSFNRLDHVKLLRELFVDIFGTPRGHPKSTSFVDRVMAFHNADNKVRPLSF
jgi:ribosome biogenesis protein BRX1